MLVYVTGATWEPNSLFVSMMRNHYILLLRATKRLFETERLKKQKQPEKVALSVEESINQNDMIFLDKSNKSFFGCCTFAFVHKHNVASCIMGSVLNHEMKDTAQLAAHSIYERNLF